MSYPSTTSTSPANPTPSPAPPSTSTSSSTSPHHRVGAIRVRNLRLNTAIVGDAWGRKGKEQPAEVCVTLWHSDGLRDAAVHDDCDRGTSYSDLVKAARLLHEWRDEFLTSAHQLFCSNMEKWGGCAVEVETFFPKGLLKGAGGWGLKTRREKEVKGTGMGTGMQQQQQQQVGRTAGRGWDEGQAGADFSTTMWYLVRNLKVACVIGVNDHEREEKQDVVINLELRRLHIFGHFGMQEEFLSSIDTLIQRVEESEFLTVEALAYNIAQFFGKTKIWSRTMVHVEKPHAISWVEGCGVEMTLDWTDEPLKD